MRQSNMFQISSEDGSEVIDLPNPEKDSAKNIIVTLVDSARNVEGVTTAQKKGRDQEKTELSWSYLEKEEWEKLLRFWDKNFFFKFTYYSRVQGTKISRTFYVGDRTDTPFDIDVDGEPVAYIDCTANVIDTGVVSQ